ncbi:MAG: transglutaminase family protein [Aestuariivirgaceae bacterium]
MRLKISHSTRYEYDSPVYYGLQQIRLTPKSRAGQKVLDWRTTVSGGTRQLEFDDEHNNHVILINFDTDHAEVSIDCEGEVETTSNDGVVGEHGGFAPLWLFLRPTDLTKPGHGVRGLVSALGRDFDDDISCLHALSDVIGEKVTYETGRTDAGTTAEDALAAGHGVCQDHAHLFVASARLLGFPARYVSGYLMMNSTVEQDASHAWAEVHVDGIGWIGFDVSNGISPDERYVRVATGLDYRDAAPVSGVRLGDSTESMIVSLQVQQ